MSVDLQTSTSVSETGRVYQLGEIVFSLKNCDPTYEKALEKLLPHFAGSELPTDRHEVNTGCSKDVPVLIRHTATVHHQRNCAWIEGSCLISPNGKKVLIAGPARSGKSTTAAALSRGRGWQTLAENFCIIDCKTNKLLKFLAPASLDDQSIEILKRIGVVIEPTFALEWRTNRVWSPVADLIGDTTYESKFDHVFWLERDEQPESIPSVSEVGLGEFARKVMPFSNLLKLKGSYDSFIESLASAHCLKMSDGDLEQRVERIIAAVTQ